ncbi:sigma 54-interacting transcriptional regulator [uncultured Bilophila sp.]|uniref:sigma-54 interaction domain-containing protein n=1 Tax=uncultured Bilophila sp. TaxID=529385 RepID=UPI00280BF9CD|nr:sigma 54-interacting transcriptional regulator [uncultured Bilophila sp.]
MYAGTVSPSDPTLAALTLSLRLSATPLSERHLSLITAQPEENVRQLLSELEGAALAARTGTAWTCGPVPPPLLDALAATVRAKIPDSRMPHYLGFLLPDATLEECEHVVRYLDEELNQQSPETLLCLEFVIRYLRDWGEAHANAAFQKSSQYAELVLIVQSLCLFLNDQMQMAVKLTPVAYALTQQSGNERFRTLVAIFGCYLKVFSDEPLPQDISRHVERLGELPDLGDKEMQDCLPLFRGILHYVRGEYPHVLKYYDQKLDAYGWKYRRFAMLLASCASQSAFYLRQYHLSLGINESSRRTAALAGDHMLSMFWMLHLAFAMLRVGDMDAALLNLDCLFMAFDSKQYNKTAISTVRGIALYHYLNGRLRAAHALLTGQAARGVSPSAPHVPFEDPLNLDMLYALEKAGFPPIPRYPLDLTIKKLGEGANRQLRGAALRVEALRLRDRGGDPEREQALLRESLDSIAGTGDRREEALSANVLADVLERTGDTASAAALRDQAEACSGVRVGRSVSYQQMVLLLTRHAPGNRLPAPSGGPHPQDSCVERCHRAFNALSNETCLASALHRLVAIAQKELKSERGALFRRDEGNGLACAAAVNLTDMELKSEQMRPCLEWLNGFSTGRSGPERGEQGLCLPLDIGESGLWLLYLDSTFTDGSFAHLHQPELHTLSYLFASEVRSALRLKKVRDEESRHQKERFQSVVLQEDRNIAPTFGAGLGELLEQVRHVSVTDAPVLILGETGVGKEVMARQIHLMSRRSGPFVAVHPASTPEHLFESEFFGHERGAFTGAIKQKLGFFEMADEGTLFIDEVGDIPPAIQTKLLRVLQEQRFIRVGGTREIYSSFRLITATNKNLWQEVQEGTFREDLLYRISVVPLMLPPLRERKQDIIPLVQNFMEHFCRRYNQLPFALNQEETALLRSYGWPGNIRELKNVIERAVILNRLPALNAPHSPPHRKTGGETPQRHGFVVEDIPTLDELERRYLEHVFNIASGRVYGEKGMTELLELKRSTLYTKLKKHGIALR